MKCYKVFFEYEIFWFENNIQTAHSINNSKPVKKKFANWLTCSVLGIKV